jgi:WD40 repeat protein
VPVALPARAGRYLVEGVIAKGGMGVVLRARDPGLNRTLAIKVLRKRFQHLPEAARRFVEEAQITGQLQHPGVPAVHEVGSLDDGQPFLAMKLIRGQTLEHQLRGPKAPSEGLAGFLATFAQVCQVVKYAHSRGVVHRDLKPLNVMVGAFGEVQVMDWGLAKARSKAGEAGAGEASCIATARAAGEQTEHGRALGTFAYMPPEQARGEVDSLDARADVFGLGAILCVILTGQPPYLGGSWDEVRRRAELGDLGETFARLEASGADGELVALAKRCLAAKKEDRPRDAGEVAKAVAAYQAGVQERLRRAELERAAAEARAAAERRARRLTVGLAAVSAAAALGLVVLLGALWHNAEERAAAVRQLGTAKSLLGDLEAQARKQEGVVEAKREEVRRLEQVIRAEGRKAREARLTTRSALYIRDLHLAAVAKERGEVGRVLLLLENHRPPAGVPDVRSFEWYHLWRTCHHELLLLAGHRQPVSWGTFAEGDRVLLTTADGGDLRMWDVLTGKERKVPGRGWGPFSSAVVAPDGKTLAIGKEDGTVELWDVTTGKMKASFQAHDGAVTKLAFGPRGERLATGGKDATAKLWDPATLRQRFVLRGHRGWIASLTFSPDGRLLATTSWDRTAKVWDVATGTEKAAFQGQRGAWVTRVAFAPDGKTWATAEAHPFNPLVAGRVEVRDAQTGKTRTTLEVRQGGAFAVAFTPDGRSLAIGGNNGTVELGDPATRRVRRIFSGHTGRVQFLAFSRSGKLLATGGNDTTVRIWDLAGLPPGVILRGHRGPVNGVAFSLPHRTKGRCGCGTPRRAGRGPSSGDIPAGAVHWLSPRTARSSPRGWTARPCGCGTWRAIGNCVSSGDTGVGSPAPRFPATARPSPRPPTTTRSGCGTLPPASRALSSDALTPRCGAWPSRPTGGPSFRAARTDG